jgi:hypothetical protein
MLPVGMLPYSLFGYHLDNRFNSFAVGSADHRRGAVKVRAVLHMRQSTCLFQNPRFRAQLSNSTTTPRITFFQIFFKFGLTSKKIRKPATISMASNSSNHSGGNQTPNFGNNPARGPQQEEAEHRTYENFTFGYTDSSGINNNSNSQQQQPQQQQPQQPEHQAQQQDEEHPMGDYPVENTRPGSNFYNAFGFGRGRGQGQGQSRGQGGNTSYRARIWRGSQYYSRGQGRGQSYSRGGRGNAGAGQGNLVTRFNRGGYGHNNYNSRSAITKATKPVERVERIDTAEVPDEQGKEPGDSAVNASSGEQNRVFAHSDTEKTVLFSEPEHVAQSARFMKDHMGANQMIARIKMVPDHLQQMARNRQLQRSTQYSDRKCPRKKGPKPKENPRVEHVGDEEGVRCVLCGSKSHAMGFCLSVLDGELKGCPLCHDTGHPIDQCQTFLAMSMNDKVRTLVDGRKNMPPLATSIPWWDYLHQWLEHDVSKNAGSPCGFPWSVEFTQKVTQREKGAFIKDIQAKFDKNHDKRSILPVDTSNNMFQSIYLKYWSSERKSFPERILEMTGEVSPLYGSAADFVSDAGGHVRN